MGQKVHPIGMRVGVIRDWDAKWYAEKEYAEFLHEDLRIRKAYYQDDHEDALEMMMILGGRDEEDKHSGKREPPCKRPGIPLGGCEGLARSLGRGRRDRKISRKEM